MSKIPKLTEVQSAIVDECMAVRDLLLQKNKEYGNAALEPLGVFSRLTAEEQIAVRIDDKLARIRATRGRQTEIHEDTEQDLIGYLILMRVARRFPSA